MCEHQFKASLRGPCGKGPGTICKGNAKDARTVSATHVFVLIGFWKVLVSGGCVMVCVPHPLLGRPPVVALAFSVVQNLLQDLALQFVM